MCRISIHVHTPSLLFVYSLHVRYARIHSCQWCKTTHSMWILLSEMPKTTQHNSTHTPIFSQSCTCSRGNIQSEYHIVVIRHYCLLLASKVNATYTTKFWRHSVRLARNLNTSVECEASRSRVEGSPFDDFLASTYAREYSHSNTASKNSCSTYRARWRTSNNKFICPRWYGDESSTITLNLQKLKLQRRRESWTEVTSEQHNLRVDAAIFPSSYSPQRGSQGF